MSGSEIGERPFGDCTVAHFGRVYADSRSSAAAWQRIGSKIRTRDGMSIYRVTRPSGEWLIAAICGDRRSAGRVLERVAWGGQPTTLTDDEVDSLVARFMEVVESKPSLDGPLNSKGAWQGVGGLGISPAGTIGPLKRPQG